MKPAALIAAAALAFVIIGGRKVAISSTVRGIRNNNPGNIRDTSGNTWDGQTGTDGEFAIFSAPEWGLRALARLLRNYESKHRLNTVRGIISRYAPSNENNTEAYISSVARALGIDPDTTFSVEARLPELMRAIIKHENGQQPYSGELIAKGISMAEGYAYA